MVVQQDNARPHTIINDAAVTEKGQKDNWNISIANLLHNSSDCGILNLGCFNAIQSANDNQEYGNIPRFVNSAQDSSISLSGEILNATRLTLQKVKESSLVVTDGSSYKMPQITKRKMDSEDQLNHVGDFDHKLYYKRSQKFTGSST